MSDDDTKKSTFRVVDRRRFDDQGNEKKESVATAPHMSPKESSAISVNDTAHQDFTVKDAHPTTIDFASFVVSLATQALMQLGEVDVPQGVDIPIDPQAAMHTIEILSMLSEKTRGNLDATESQLMEEVLHSLRMAYVKSTKSQ